MISKDIYIDSFTNIFCEASFAEYKQLISENYIKAKSKAELKRIRSSASVYSEIHHIIPKSMGGEDSKENLVILSAKDHIRAHYLLFKITQSEKMLFAFNQMRRCIDKVADKTFLETIFEIYQNSKELISEHMSKINKGRFASKTELEKEATRTRMSLASKGKVPVRIKRTEETIRIRTDSFDPEIHEYIGTGLKRSTETKMRMSESNKAESKGTQYRNLETNQIKYFKLGSKIPEGWVPGNGAECKHSKETIWVNDGTKNKRIKSTEEIPLGFKIGRIAANVFSSSKVGVHPLTNSVFIGENLPEFYVNYQCRFIITFQDLSGCRYVSGSIPEIQRVLEIKAGIKNTISHNPDCTITKKCGNEYLILNHFGEKFAELFKISWIHIEQLTQEYIDETLRSHKWI